VDVYDDTPTIVTIWLTIMPKISILILLLELYTQIDFISGINSLTITTNGYIEYLNSTISLNSSINSEEEVNKLLILSPLSLVKGIFVENIVTILTNLLLISSLLSLIIGSIVGLAQVRIKRLLAYSTISHIGFILLALAIKTEQSIDSLLFYIIQYSITNLNIFLIIIALGYIITNIKNELNITDIKYISEFKHHFFFNPLISLSLTICLFSMAGINEVC
jgi:NADH-ubiquinone oxidoreductase chain 2